MCNSFTRLLLSRDRSATKGLIREARLAEDFGARLTRSLRTLAWLDAGRVRVYAAMVLVAYLPMMVKVYREATGTVGSQARPCW